VIAQTAGTVQVGRLAGQVNGDWRPGSGGNLSAPAGEITVSNSTAPPDGDRTSRRTGPAAAAGSAWGLGATACSRSRDMPGAEHDKVTAPACGQRRLPGARATRPGQPGQPGRLRR